MTRDTWLRLAVTVGALAVGAVHAFWPSALDTLTAALLFLAALPWLAPIIKSIGIAGVGNIELRELEKKTNEARGAAASANAKADLALAGASPGADATRERSVAPVPQELWALADEYNRIRETQPSGPARTSAMTSVVRRMIDASPDLSIPEVSSLLQDRDRGRRLIAYSYLYERPDRSLLGELVRSVAQVEDKPFGQYWGVSAIGRVVGGLRKDEIGNDTLEDLLALRNRLEPGTDRRYELDRILSSLGL